MILAGGTGGHVYPALAVARALQQQCQEVVWLGTHLGIESRLVPEAGIPIEWVAVSGLRGKGLAALLFAPFKLLYALSQSLYVMWKHRPAAVLGMGGFVSGPGGLAAWLTCRPLVIHEQNAVSGLTNRLLARLARVVLQAFPGSFKARINAETVGNPVREEIASIDDPTIRFAGRQGPMRLLVLGGSLGALALNQVVPAALALLPPGLRPRVRHQTGQRTLAEARTAYAQHGIDADLSPYIEDMAAAYSWADLVICRAGALTVAELSAAGLPAIFVPFPSAVDDHQTANAQPMADAGAATVVPQSELSDESLAGLLRNWLASREALLERALKSRSLARPDALKRITRHCLDCAGVAA
jgi:UDP-N-acetylglucosamine--N-acetylmuramyl-(pentapeptide) pyrophosphoryl-undecaprenol N-acetylglucosamine transferase